MHLQLLQVQMQMQMQLLQRRGAAPSQLPQQQPRPTASQRRQVPAVGNSMPPSNNAGTGRASRHRPAVLQHRGSESSATSQAISLADWGIHEYEDDSASSALAGMGLNDNKLSQGDAEETAAEGARPSSQEPSRHSYHLPHNHRQQQPPRLASPHQQQLLHPSFPHQHPQGFANALPTHLQIQPPGGPASASPLASAHAGLLPFPGAVALAGLPASHESQISAVAASHLAAARAAAAHAHAHLHFHHQQREQRLQEQSELPPGQPTLLRQQREQDLREQEQHPLLPPHAWSLQQHLDLQVRELQRRLHVELVALEMRCRAAQERTMAQVLDVRARVAKVASRCFGYDARVELFGSFATGLAVAGVSDADLVVLFPSEEQLAGGAGAAPGGGAMSAAQMCRVLGRVLMGADGAEWASSLKVLDRAKMPVIKLVAMGTLPVDLSFAQPSHAGLATAALVRHMLRGPGRSASGTNMLSPMVFALKTLLASRALSDPFTGGLGSYALVLMVAASIDRSLAAGRGRDREAATATNGSPQPHQALYHLGELLMDFLQLFGHDFDPAQEAVVCVRAPGALATMDPSLALPFQMRVGARAAAAAVGAAGDFSCAAALVVDDPVQAGNNVGGTCFRFSDVQRLLVDTLAELISYTARANAITQQSANAPLLDLLFFKSRAAH
jgi:hypothetical protein